MFWHYAARAATAVFCAVVAISPLRFFQQTGYNVARGYVRICRTFIFLLSVACCLLLLCVHIWGREFSDLLLVISALVICLSEIFGKAKVPLRFTPRATRLFCLNCLAIVAVCVWVPVFVVPVAPFLTVPLCGLLLLPVEKVIHSKYIKRATEKLDRAKYIKIAVTGSFGKTSVKNILAQMLSKKYKTFCTPSSFNTPLGISKFVNNDLPSDAEAVIFEMGAKKRGDIAFLCKMVKPKYGILTGVEKQHLSTFRSVDNIVAAKGELLDYIPQDGLCVLNADNVFTRRFNLSKCPTRTAGQKGEVRVSDVRLSAEGSTFSLTLGENTREVCTELLGSFNAVNIALAAALAYELDVTAEDIFNVIARLSPTPHRLQPIENASGAIVIDDSYNANISGVMGAVEALKCFGGRKYVITQGIVELGREQFDENFKLGKIFAETFDCIVTLGQNAKALTQGVRAVNPSKTIFSTDSVADAVERLKPFISCGDVILFQNDLPDSMI